MRGRQSSHRWVRLTGLAAVLLVFVAACAPLQPVRDAGTAPPVRGSYQLVGIGPGDGDLMTVRALNALREADIVLCSAQTREKVSAYVPFGGKQVLDGYGLLFPFYGKDCSKLPEEERSWRGMSCEQYHRRQAELAALVRGAVAEGKNVAMASGGDPTIYGPGVWTLHELRDLNPTVVPGISSFNAANAALQVSLGEIILTAPLERADHRDSLESLSGHERATMVIFMPRDLKAVMARLAKVHPGSTPVAVVTRAGESGMEKVVTGTIRTIESKLQGVDDWLSLIYVGKAVGDAPRNPSKRKGLSTRGKSKGIFHLVGVGPGDPDLASLRALKVIEEADLIFAGKRIRDRFSRELQGKTVIEGYERLFPFYGKKCSQLTEEEKARERMSCEEYHRKQAEFAVMVRQAVARGQKVAMLDNGDPLIYGPCAWSLTELRDLSTEVVPGLSAFNAANAALRTGVTEGKDSHSVLLASGWSVEEMAVHRATMVLFTMRTEFRTFVDKLSRAYPSDTPVAIVSSAGYKEKESVMRGTLGSILEQVGESKLPFEYLLYVGDFLTPPSNPSQSSTGMATSGGTK